MKVSILVFAIIYTSLCHAASIQKKSSADNSQLKDSDLFEIDLETQPEDGTIKGLRIRRSGENNPAIQNIESDDENFNYPEIDIQKINDDSIQINGIRIRRNDLKDLADVDIDEEDDSEGASSDRTRRSGDLLGFIGHKIQQKLSLLASASSGHNAESDLHYGTPVTSYNTKAFDIWAFKKAILNTLLQAVKAIKGGVIALGGQIIKAKGHLISTKGKVIATKGEALSEFGRHIAANALLSHPVSAPATAFATAAVDHDAGYAGGVSSGYGVPVQSSYAAPLTSNYGPPQHGYTKRGATTNQFGVPQELPNGVQAGLLVLKPINVAEGSQQPNYGKRNLGSGFAARDSQSSQSEINPVQEEAQERSYYYQ